MNLKKNAFSYFAWLILLFFTGATCAFLGLLLSRYIKIDMIFIAAGLVTVFFVVVFLLYFLIGILVERQPIKNNYLKALNISQTLERILVIALICIGFVLRAALISHAGEEAAYFEVTKITGKDDIMVRSVQGSVYIYCLLLRGLFYLVGNHWIAGIWLQIGLQLIGALLIYIGIKKVLSNIPALLVLGFILFAPVSIKAGLYYSPQMLFFCIFAIAFDLLASYIKCSMNKETKGYLSVWILTILVGVTTGLTCYLDISGFVLLFLVAVLPMVIREESSNIWIKGLVVIVVLTIMTLFTALWIDSMLSQAGIDAILDAWRILYGNHQLRLNVMIGRLSGEFIVLIALACCGCFSFWRKTRSERLTPFILMAIGMCILVFSGATTENMDGSYLLHILLAILASVSITEMFEKTDKRINSEEEEEIREVEIKEEKKIEFIENPLPLPKKHVRKTMDYAFMPEADQMKYDVAVSDNDDFDLK